jgi:hypothetical protein
VRKGEAPALFKVKTPVDQTGSREIPKVFPSLLKRNEITTQTKAALKEINILVIKNILILNSDKYTSVVLGHFCLGQKNLKFS